MEISILNPLGRKVVALFNGGVYVFYSEFYGTLAIAKRSNVAQEHGHELFTITAGNRHTIGGSFSNSVILGFVKRFIRKSENKYIFTVVDFETHEKDLADIQPATLAE